MVIATARVVVVTCVLVVTPRFCDRQPGNQRPRARSDNGEGGLPHAPAGVHPSQCGSGHVKKARAPGSYGVVTRTGRLPHLDPRSPWRRPRPADTFPTGENLAVSGDGVDLDPRPSAALP